MDRPIDSGYYYCYCNVLIEVAKMSNPAIKISIFLLAFINMIAISVLVYKKKQNIAICLGLLELILIFSSNLLA